MSEQQDANSETTQNSNNDDKKKRWELLPKIKQGNDSKEEYDTYTVYDWESIREEEKGQASIKDKSPEIINGKAQKNAEIIHIESTKIREPFIDKLYKLLELNL